MKWYNLKNLIEYSAIILFAKVFKFFPWTLVQHSGTFLGNLVYYLIPIRKKVVLQNLQNTFVDKSPREIRTIARRCYVNFGKNIFEFIKLYSISEKELLKHVQIENQELLNQARQLGRGTICINGHFGNWELMAAAISLQGYNINGIAKEQRNKRVDLFIQDVRLKTRVKTIFLGMALRGVMSALKKNHIVALLIDQDAHREGVFVDFLGRPSATAPGPAFFSLKNKSPLLFCSPVRDTKGNHRIRIELIKTDDLDGVTEKNIRILTQRHSKVLEKYIYQNPDHWFWMHKRWKTDPPSDYRPLDLW